VSGTALDPVKAARSYAVSFSALAALPLVMAGANRSAPLMVLIAAFFACLASYYDGSWRKVIKIARQDMTARWAVISLAFLCFSLLSILWSETKSISAFSFAELTLSLGLSCLLALILPQASLPRLIPWLMKCLVISCLLACLLLVIDQSTNFALRQWLGSRPYGFIYNRSVLTLLVIALPAGFWFFQKKDWIWLGLTLTAICIMVLMSDSGAAKLGLMVALLSLSGVYLLKRVTFIATTFFIILMLIGAPWLGLAAQKLIPGPLHERMAEGHTRERMEIWLGFGEAVRAHPWIGNGFGASARFMDSKPAGDVKEKHRTWLAAGHPHNVAMQIWVELGVIGIALATLLIITILRALFLLPKHEAALGLALLSSSMAVMMVGHGAWQGWWAASLGASLTLCLITNKELPDERI
jgi:O-antigen ligase